MGPEVSSYPRFRMGPTLHGPPIAEGDRKEPMPIGIDRKRVNRTAKLYDERVYIHGERSEPPNF